MIQERDEWWAKAKENGIGKLKKGVESTRKVTDSVVDRWEANAAEQLQLAQEMRRVKQSERNASDQLVEEVSATLSSADVDDKAQHSAFSNVRHRHRTHALQTTCARYTLCRWRRKLAWLRGLIYSVTGHRGSAWRHRCS